MAGKRNKSGGKKVKVKDNGIVQLWEKREAMERSGEKLKSSTVERVFVTELEAFWVEHLRISFSDGLNSECLNSDRVRNYLNTIENLVTVALPPEEEFERLIRIVNECETELAVRAFNILTAIHKLHPPTALSDAVGDNPVKLLVNRQAWEPIGSSARLRGQDFKEEPGEGVELKHIDELKRVVRVFKNVSRSLRGEPLVMGSEVGTRLLFVHFAKTFLDDLKCRTKIFEQKADKAILFDSTLWHLLDRMMQQVGKLTRSEALVRPLIDIIRFSQDASVDYEEHELATSVGELRDVAAELLQGAMSLYNMVEESGHYHTQGRISRFTGRNDRVKIDQEIVQYLWEFRDGREILAVLRAIETPENRVRIITRMIARKTTEKFTPVLFKHIVDVGAAEQHNASIDYIKTGAQDFFEFLRDYINEARIAFEVSDNLSIVVTQLLHAIRQLQHEAKDRYAGASKHMFGKASASVTDTVRATIAILLTDEQNAYAIRELEWASRSFLSNQ